jgi:hypothetical protein
MIGNRLLQRLAIGLLVVLPGCGESGGSAPDTGGAGIPGLRGPAATPKGKAAGKARPAIKPAESETPPAN